MTFLAPHFLWGLLALLPLTAVFLLKVKPKVHQTNAWFLWQKVFEEKQSSSLFSKLRHLWSLLLLAIATILLVLALASPRFSEQSTQDKIIIIDTSASMGTKDGITTRIDKAKTDAHNMIRNLSGNQRVLIATLDNKLTFLTHLTRNTKDLHDAVDSLEASDLPLSPNAVEEISNILESSNDKSSHRVVLLSDGCGTFELLENHKDKNIQSINYFNQANNIGIIGADIQRLPGENNPAQCMVQLASSNKEEKEIELEIIHTATGTIGKINTIKVSPGQNKPIFFRLNNVEDGQWEARILEEDSLDQDNLVHMQIQPLRAIPIATLAEDKFFYERCVEAFQYSGGGLILSSLEDAVLTLSHGSAPQSNQDTLVFAPTGESNYWSEIGNDIEVEITEAKNADHPALRHLDLNYMRFPGAKKIKAPESATILVETHDGIPLIYVVNEANKSIVIVNLDPSEGEFVLSPWFPVLIYDVASYLDGTTKSLQSLYSTGSQISFDTTENIQVTSPDGAENSITPGNSIPLDQAGTYTIEQPKNTHTITASLLSFYDTTQASQLAALETTEVKAPISLSFWFIILAVLIITAEYILYHRRKVG